LVGLLDTIVDGQSALQWTDVVMVSNVGAIPPAREAQGDFVWNRGFNLLVVGSWGNPRYFCKCRRAGDERLLREIRIMKALNEDVALQHHVPRVASAQSSRLQIMSTKYVGARTLLEALHGPARPGFTKIVMASVDAILAVSRHATSRLRSMVLEGQIVLAREVKPVLDYLRGAGVGSDDLTVIERIMDGVPPLSRMLQHGDAWPNNLIWRRGSVWLLDFEMFGEVQVPMYDVFHFLRTCSDLWSSNATRGQAWCDRMQAGDVATTLAQTAARHAMSRLGLSAQQAAATLVYYVAHFAATTHRRNPDGVFWERFLREVRRMTECIRNGTSLDQLFLGR